MLHGPIALFLRYLLMLAGSSLVTVGILTPSPTGFCLDLGTASDVISSQMFAWLSGLFAIVSAVVWRFYAKVRGGTT